MEITDATEAHVSNYADEFAELIHATGPVTYDYQFLRRALFDDIVKASWATPGTLFAYDETISPSMAMSCSAWWFASGVPSSCNAGRRCRHFGSR